MPATMTTEATVTVVREGAEWTVPSRTTAGVIYTIRKDRRGLLCNCDNAMAGQSSCWHLRAVGEYENARMKWNRARRSVVSEETRRAALAMLMAPKRA